MTAEVTAPMPAKASGRELMRASRLYCQRGGPPVSGDECLSCSRIVSVLPSQGRRSLTVRCLWTETDRVESVMTRPDAFVTVGAKESVGRADLIAAREHVHHVLVLDHGAVIGVACRCDLAEPGSPAAVSTVAAHMKPTLWTVPPETTLGQAARLMGHLEESFLGVAVGDQLVGVVTLHDLGLSDQGHWP